MFRPLGHLKRLLEEKSVCLEEMPAVRIPDSGGKRHSPREETALFLRAMEGVRRLRKPNLAECNRPYPQSPAAQSEDDRVRMDLQALVETGRGFRVADTPEYIEGKGYCVPDETVRRLHQGVYAIQAHIDLHGMCAAEAMHAVDSFLHQATREGLRAVLIIHGRGLSSPRKPVLKTRLVQQLERSYWQKWILAYTSARNCDGGTGATYVLLRSRPVSKGRRRQGAPA